MQGRRILTPANNFSLSAGLSSHLIAPQQLPDCLRLGENLGRRPSAAGCNSYYVNLFLSLLVRPRKAREAGVSQFIGRLLDFSRPHLLKSMDVKLG